VSPILELLGRGLDRDVSDVLDRYFWSPPGAGVAELRQRCEEHPDVPECHLQFALACLADDRLDEAVECLERACGLRSNYHAARLALAAACDASGNAAGALKQLETINIVRPGQPAVLLAMGLCQEKLGQRDPAAALYRRAVDANVSLPTARERLAAVAVAGGDLDEAIDQYLALRDAEPQEAGYRSSLAHLYLLAGRHGDAIDEYQTSICMEPESWSLADDKAEELIAAGRLDEAMSRLAGLIDEQGPFACLHVRMGDLHRKLGDDEAAREKYLTALEIQPTHVEATVKLGTYYADAGWWDEAAEAFHRAAELNDQVLLYYVGLGVAQAASGDRSEAYQSIECAAAIDPNSTLLVAETAKLQLKSSLSDPYTDATGQGDPPAPRPATGDEDLLAEQTRHHLEAVGRDDADADLHYRCGMLLRAGGRNRQAMEQFEWAARISDRHVKARLRLGIIRQELGQRDEAIDTFYKAMSVEPESIESHYRLGLLYTNRRRFEQKVRQMEAHGTAKGAPVRTELALSLQNMGLMDPVAATWRSLWRVHRARAG